MTRSQCVHNINQHVYGICLARVAKSKLDAEKLIAKGMLVSSRYYFDLDNGQESIIDKDGVSAQTTAHAIHEALAVIEEMRRAGEIDFDENWDLVIRDAEGSTVKRLPIQ